MITVVTGGAGFIGSNLVDALVARGDEVRVLDDLSTGYADNVDPRASLVEGDIADEYAVLSCLEGADVVFHEAAHRSVLGSVEHPLETDRANVHGTLTVLDAAWRQGVRRVVCASSSSVYGGAAARPTTEDAPTRPLSPYAVSKLTGELYARVYAELHGLETVSLRYFNAFGPRQRPDSAYAAVIPLFIDALEQGRQPTVYGDGLQSRDFTFISDVVRANLAAAEAPPGGVSGRVFNIAGGHSYSLLELLGMLGEILGCDPAPLFAGPRAGDVRHSSASIEAARSMLAWEPEVDIRQGLRSTVEWFSNGG